MAESKIECTPRPVPVAAVHEAQTSTEPVRSRGSRVRRDTDPRVAHSRKQPLKVGMAVARIQRSHSHSAKIASSDVVGPRPVLPVGGSVHGWTARCYQR